MGRVEEIRKETKLKAEVMSRLVDKYDLLEKGHRKAPEKQDPIRIGEN